MEDATEATPPVQTGLADKNMKTRKGRGPTVARWQVVINTGPGCGPDFEDVTIQSEKYISEDAALKAIASGPIQGAIGLFRRVETETKVIARLV